MLPFISFIGNLARIPLKGLFRKACLVKLVAYCLPLGVSFLCGGGPSELDVMRVMTSWPSSGSAPGPQISPHGALRSTLRGPLP